MQDLQGLALNALSGDRGARIRHLLAAWLMGALFWVALLSAQFTTASLVGTAVDASGASVPQAKVTVLNTNTGLTRTDLTGADGAFAFPALPVGAYRLTVEKTGFSTYVQEGITLTVNQEASLPVTLQVGSTANEITVNANAAMVNTQTATINQLVNQRQMIDLPLNGRTAQSLVFIAAGTIPLSVPSQGGIYGGSAYPTEQMAGVSGAGSANVNYLMDGAGHNDTYVNMNMPFPNPDAIQEFNLQSGSMSAEYGQSAAVVNIVTKSGTNSLHGDLFEFVRNGAMNARNFFAPTPDTLKRNQFGGTVGGPIRKNQLFFFGTYQGTRLRSAPAGVVSFVPTPAERNGDFSSISKQLVNPTDGTPFPGNQIPASLITTPSKYFLGLIPLPNGPGGQLTYLGPAAKPDDDQTMTKIDWTHGRHQVSGHYFYTKFNQQPDTTTVKSNLLAMDTNGNQVRVETVSVNDVFSVRPTLLLNTWFGWDSQVGGSLSGDPTGSSAITFARAGVAIADGAPGMPAALDSLSVSGYFSAGGSHWGDFNRGDWRLREVATAEKGSHELIFGGEVIRIAQDINNTNTQTGTFPFAGQYSGNNLADFLLGAASGFTQGAGQYQNVRATVPSLFFQDNWHVNSRLVLNLGLRWDPWWPYREIRNRVPCFAPSQQSVRYPNAPVGLIFGGDAGCPADTAYNARIASFAPRAGFAYRVDSKTVIRGGAGIFYSLPASDLINGTVTTAPFSTRFILSRTSFVDPFGAQGIPNPFPADYTNGGVPGSTAQFTVPTTIYNTLSADFNEAEIGSWNLRLERQLRGNWLVGAAYVGNGAWHLSGNHERNPAIYIPGASTTLNTQARRAIPQFSTVGQAVSDLNSNYHSLQLNMEKRFSKGLSLMANYAWSKNMANDWATDPFSRSLDYARASADVPQLLHFTALWAIPELPLHGLAGRALNGWELSSLTTWQSGFPFSVMSGVDNSLTGVGSDRADFTGTSLSQAMLGGQSHAQEIQQFFNTSLFARNAIGTFGDSGKNILRGPRSFNTDLALLKDTAVTERSKLQLRAEFFNVFNNVNFSNPGGTVGTASFGKITTAGNPRILQLALKFVF